MRRVLQKTPGRPEVRCQSLIVLKAILAEVSGGAGQPFSADSYLPAHLIDAAREAIAHDERVMP